MASMKFKVCYDKNSGFADVLSKISGVANVSKSKFTLRRWQRSPLVITSHVISDKSSKGRFKFVIWDGMTAVVQRYLSKTALMEMIVEGPIQGDSTANGCKSKYHSGAPRIGANRVCQRPLMNALPSSCLLTLVRANGVNSTGTLYRGCLNKQPATYLAVS